MEFVKENAPFLLGDYSYTEEEVRVAREIRTENSAARKQFLIECFEDVYAKPFPTSEPVMDTSEFEPNVSTLLLNTGHCNHRGDYTISSVRPRKKARGLKAGYNMYTALVSSLESERCAAQVELDPFTRISRKSEF